MQPEVSRFFHFRAMCEVASAYPTCSLLLMEATMTSGGHTDNIELLCLLFASGGSLVPCGAGEIEGIPCLVSRGHQSPC